MLQISLHISYKFDTFILPKSITVTLSDVSRGCRNAALRKHLFKEQTKLYLKTGLAVYFDILMFFSSINDR